MPKVSGKDLISEITEKSGRRLIVISSIVILVKLYNVNLSDLSIFGLALPAELFDVVAIFLVAYFVYTLTINWVADLSAFRLWYSESEIWSEFRTNMKLDRNFISGGVKLLSSLFELEKKDEWPSNFTDLSEEQKTEFNDFKTNVGLYTARLSAAGVKFKTLSRIAGFYVWFQAFILPMIIGAFSIFLLFQDGSFLPPSNSGENTLEPFSH